MEENDYDKLISAELCDNQHNLSQDLTDKFKEAGSLYFEHGYPKPLFNLKKYGCANLYAITFDGYARFFIPSRNNEFIKVPFAGLTFAQLQRIINISNDYYLYCKYEA